MMPSIKSVLHAGEVALFALFFAGLASAAPITSVQGFLADPNNRNVIVFDYDPVVHGPTLNIQTWGYGGTANAPGGTNLLGNILPAGGFDPIVTLFFGTGDSATFVAYNDDGSCPPGTPSPNCYDTTLNLTGLSAGTYSLILTAYSNFALADEAGETLGLGFEGGGSLDGRSANFAVDVQGIAAVPEPGTFVLLGSALAGVLGFRSRHRLTNRRRA